MELEEAEDEAWDTSKYLFKNNARNGCIVSSWVLKWGLCLGRKILVAGFVASVVPVVVPPLVVASAIGLTVSMPYAIFLASHVCTQNLMSKLLPRPTPQDPPLHEEMCFQPGSAVTHTYKEEQEALADETNRDIEMVDVQYMKNGGNGTSESECGPQEDASDGETNGMQVQLISGGNGVETMIEQVKAPFDVTTIVLEESQDQAIEGDIEEAELQRETKGLLEKIRDEGRTDMTRERGEYLEGICGGANETNKKIGQVVEDMEVAWEDTHRSTIVGTEEDSRKEEDLNVCEEMLHSRNDESEDTMLEGKEFYNTNDSQKSMAEPSELLIPAEPIGDLPIEVLVYNIPVDEDSSEVIGEKTDIHTAAKEEPKMNQKEKIDNNISDIENQESQLHKTNERMYSSDAEVREIVNESALDLFDGKRIDPDEYAFPIDLHGESSNFGGHTDSMEVLVSSVEQESRSSDECSSRENVVCPSQEVVFDEENMWKEINVIRKVVGYEGRKQASCADELKALYLFTGVEPPSSLNENSSDPTEIKEKLQFLMSIVGIKSNVA